MTHQRAFMSALFHRVSSPAVWANPFRWYPVATSTADAITLAEGDHSWNLAQLGWALAGSVQNLTMPIGSFSENWAGDIVTWDQDASSRLFRRPAYRPTNSRRPLTRPGHTDPLTH